MRLHTKLIYTFFTTTLIVAALCIGLIIFVFQLQNILPIIIIGLFGVTVLSIISGLVSYYLVISPLLQLQEATKEMEKGNFSARISVQTGDELEEIAERFNKTSTELSRTEEVRRELDNAKTEFLSITSHELRSPITPIKGQLQMLDQGMLGDLNESQRESVQMALRNVNRLDKIIFDFLEISRIEAARLKFNFVPMEIDKLLADVVEGIKYYLPQKNVTIKVKHGALPLVQADPDRTAQVLRNLLENAVKFTPQNGKVELGVKEESHHILFWVKDNGIGLTHTQRMRLFEPFYQAEQTVFRGSRGVGLGLAICKGIVESQNGKIWVESEFGKGSTFFFTLPKNPTLQMRSIPILFSKKNYLRRRLLETFHQYIGIMGASELEGLESMGDITNEKLERYIRSLQKSGIISPQGGKEFLENVRIILSEKPPAESE